LPQRGQQFFGQRIAGLDFAGNGDRDDAQVGRGLFLSPLRGYFSLCG
jgi:hypothetical protein